MFPVNLTSYIRSIVSVNPKSHHITIVIITDDWEQAHCVLTPSVILPASFLPRLPRSPFPPVPMIAAQLNEQDMT